MVLMTCPIFPVSLQSHPRNLHVCVCTSAAQHSAGAGGDEAGIWAGDLLRMYTRYAASQGWRASLINLTEADAGGYKEAVLQARCC